jgi:hypothetical protein
MAREGYVVVTLMSEHSLIVTENVLVTITAASGATGKSILLQNRNLQISLGPCVELIKAY